MGIFWDLDQPAKERQAKRIEGLLGEAPQEAVIGELGRFGVNLQPAQPGSGFLGSDRGAAEQARLLTNLQTTGGLNPQQATGILGALQPQAQKATTLMQNLTAAGVDLNTSQGQAKMLEALMKPQTQINMGAGAGTMWTPEQVKQAGLPADSVVTEDRYGKPQILNKEKYTQAQHLSSGFATRMFTANKELTDVADLFPSFDPTSARFHSNIMLPDWLSSMGRTSEGQRYKQAQDNWISANLRKESGAVLGEQEIEQERAKWFPAMGDSKDVIGQKTRSRKDAENAMQKASGGAYKELLDKADSDRLSELRDKHGAK